MSSSLTNATPGRYEKTRRAVAALSLPFVLTEARQLRQSLTVRGLISSVAEPCELVFALPSFFHAFDPPGQPVGQVGNFLLAGHRTAAGGPMNRVPKLDPGDKIVITRDRKEYVYTVAYKLWINFRKKQSRRLQILPVPGRPGEVATKPAIVLSTCATSEDIAAGRNW